MTVTVLYGEYEYLLLKLHCVIRDKGLESDEAEAVRDEMEGMWELFSSDEKASLAKLSDELSGAT